MTGRGLDQVMAHPGDPTLYEPWIKSALEYVALAERRNGPIPRSVAPSYIWGDLLGVLEAEAVHARIINLETAVTDLGSPWPGKRIHYRMHPQNAGALTVALIDCCVLANNHVLDWSYPGLEQTLDTLHRVGLATVGAGADREEADRPAVVEAGPAGRVVVVGLGAASSGIPGEWAAGHHHPGVAFTWSPSDADVDSIAARVHRTARDSDVVVVSIHWGGNWGYGIPLLHRRFAHALIDHAGVDLVHGHSSHHPLGIEVYRDRLILYGCGDLINDYEGIGGHEEYHPDVSVAYLARIDSGGGLLGLEMVPMRIRGFRLEHAPPGEVTWLAQTLNREGRPLGTGVEAVDERLHLIW